MSRIDNFTKQVDYKLNGVEALLWLGSAVPGLNLITGPTKTLLGTAQVASALALTLLSIPACFTESGRKLAHWGFKHMVHGSANIFSGLIFTIPIVSTFVILHYVGKTGAFCPIWEYNHLPQSAWQKDRIVCGMYFQPGI